MCDSGLIPCISWGGVIQRTPTWNWSTALTSRALRRVYVCSSIEQVNHDVAVDTSSDPSVYITRVYSAMEDGAYGVGEAILVTVVFSAPVRDHVILNGANDRKRCTIRGLQKTE